MTRVTLCHEFQDRHFSRLFLLFFYFLNFNFSLHLKIFPKRKIFSPILITEKWKNIWLFCSQVKPPNTFSCIVDLFVSLPLGAKSSTWRAVHAKQGGANGVIKTVLTLVFVWEGIKTLTRYHYGISTKDRVQWPILTIIVYRKLSINLLHSINQMFFSVNVTIHGEENEGLCICHEFGFDLRSSLCFIIMFRYWILYMYIIDVLFKVNTRMYWMAN